MSYDPNSLEAQKGALGEKIAIKKLQDWDAIVTRPDGSPPEKENTSLMDFLAVPAEGSKFAARYVEVKVRKGAIPYAHGQYPCYSFPIVQIEAYEKFCAANGLHGELWIIDLSKGVIVAAELDSPPDPNDPWCLENKRFVDRKQFPFDQDTAIGKMRFFHQEQFCTIKFLTDEELAQFQKIEDSVVSSQPDSAAVAKQETAEPPLYAVMLPRGVRDPNGKILTVFATKNGAFLSLAQLTAACVIPEDELKPYLTQLANYEGFFVNTDCLFDFFRDRADFDNDTYQWWTCKGTNEAITLWQEFLDRRDFVLQHLGFSLPEEWARLANERDNVFGKLKQMPYFIPHRLVYNLRCLTTTISERNLTDFFSDACEKICDERLQAVKLPVKVAEFPDKILGVSAGDTESPDGVAINFYDVDGKIFVHGAQLAMSAGYSSPSGATSDYTDFSKAVAAVAQYYAVQRKKSSKPVRCVNLDDVPAVLDEFAFNHTDNQEQYEKASTFARWWREQNFSFDKPAPQSDSITEMLAQLSSSLNVDAEALSQAILDLRQKAFEQEQARLKDLLTRKK